MKILRFFLILLASLGFNSIHASKSGNQVITPEYIQKIHLQDPARALHLLDSAEQHHLPGIRPFETDILRTMCYEVTGECILEEKYARRALASDSVQLVPSRKIRMLVALMRSLVEQGKNEDAIRCGEEAIALARLLHDEGREGETLRNIGNIYRNMNRPGEALKLYRQGIEAMKKSTNVLILANLSTSYGEMMALLMNEKRLEEAVETGKEREALIKRMAGMPGPPPGYIDQQYGFHYSKMAYLLMLKGDAQKAEAYYRKYLQTDFSQSSSNAGQIIPYLLEAQRYADALKLNQNDRKNYQETYGNDTINYTYLIILDRFAQAYRGLRLYKEADAYQQLLSIVSDSIYSREQASRAHQYAMAFNLHEKDLQLVQSQLQSQKRGFLLIGSFVVILMLCALTGIILRNWRVTLRRNRIAAKQINELLAQREEARNTCCQHTITLLDAEKEEQGQTDKPEDTPQNAAGKDSNSLEYERFLRMEYTLVHENLFLQPDFGRDELISLSNTNKNDLPRILRKYANADNVSSYLNRLRVEYAIKLMKEKPNLSFDAIAKEASFNSHSTFYRAFYKVCGMTPAQYMKAFGKENDSPFE